MSRTDTTVDLRRIGRVTSVASQALITNAGPLPVDTPGAGNT